ncbi:glutathione S-transferase family protein [Pseudemcibacter aquimaris]|uniref:glutathione S-transferase family protein n=1 Tax=Pseudemcibacter aquimaris TaxID=2857064 RepID=UPI002012A940|nr:glutathione S-transferase family protein [Pseudemcibacter aquimaris]MCC3862456.1 glutathione S-transferase family protein [Pseudemcibacter aquimaris]WDU59116.1 glutathione S-transferase family protein [Pseudemcibacter aquimaris]
MLILHDNIESGNAYKVRLLLSLLGKEYKCIQYDVVNGETRTPEYLANINKNGRIPVLEFEDGRCLPESNAILYYMAKGTKYFPDDDWEQAKVMEWMCFEQYSHEPFVAVAKFILTMLPKDTPRRAEIPTLHEKGYAALQIMEDHLSEHKWLVGEHMSIADIALYAYTHKAHMGDFDMSRFKAIEKWCKNIEAEPNYIKMF